MTKTRLAGLLSWLLLAAALFAWFSPTHAQSGKAQTLCTPIGTSGSCIPVGMTGAQGAVAPYTYNWLPVGGLANAAAPTYIEGRLSGLSFDLSGNLRTVSSGGGVSAVTIADGADVAEGATTDAAATQGGTGTLSAKLRLMTTQFNTLNTTVATAANQTTMGTNQTAVQGPVPASAATATKFNMVGGENRTTLPTLTNTQQGPAQLDTRGGAYSDIKDNNGTTGNTVKAASTAAANTDTALVVDLPPRALLTTGTAGTPSAVVVTQQGIASMTPVRTFPVPTALTEGGITPVVSGSAEATHVLKASAGNLYSVYAINLTATAGFLSVINATSAPADGAQTPLACVPLPANGSASINFNPGPVQVYSIGITAIVTSATTCFTKTTSVITAFISGSVQ